ncbi:aspartate/glutamate racemase family protein [Shewanella nanhaiensis]|uniref:Aspartate/glutamate racemase family protein n=1 Tax=Shewanella nanhaiensis TaxID=2864872 RepID=A0ABS7DZX5_9GAMM|nr:aspartate/glutamate racemase family protein [Shewanella nanhaiensis]MBW8182491.1 aspartate/glutamate racemase family protein [Shewanella nanhaiensis]
MNNQSKIRIRWLNPIAQSHYDEPMGMALKQVANEGTEVEVVSLQSEAKMDNLEYRFYESLVIGDVVKVAKEGDVNGVDAMVIGCFYDLALEDCREICQNTLVVAPCQASMQVAANIANKFSVIVGQVKWIEQMTERAERYGYGGYLASMRSIDMSANSLQCDTQVTTDRIIEAGRLAIEEDHAEALILGCTCNFGLYEKVQQELGVPVIDPLIAALKQAEMLASMKHAFNLAPSNKWSCEPPSESEMLKFGLHSLTESIGNRFLIS